MRTSGQMADTENVCFALITLLWRLDIIKYSLDDLDDDRDSFIWQHHKGLIKMWYQIYVAGEHD